MDRKSQRIFFKLQKVSNLNANEAIINFKVKLIINTAFLKFVTLSWHVSLAVKLSDNKAFSFLSAAARFYMKGLFLSRESTLKQLKKP